MRSKSVNRKPKPNYPPTLCLIEDLEPRRLLSVSAALVSDLSPGDLGSSPAPFVVAGNEAFFLVTSTTSGVTSYSLYATNGTPDGTTLVQTFSNLPSNLTASGNLVYFRISQQQQLWRSDGTPAGTFPVGTFGANSPLGGDFTDVNGTLFFDVNGTAPGLWKSGGTAETTVPLSDPGRIISISNMINASGILYFSAATPAANTDVELWQSDGTDAGTAEVKDIATGSAGSLPQNMTSVNGKLYFWADDRVHGRSLWSSDGTDAGTVLIKSPGDLGISGAGAPGAAVGNELYFTALAGSVRQLFKSDGTAAGTAMVANLGNGIDAMPDYLTSFAGELYFAATTPDHGRELWKTDGTPEGTIRVTDIAQDEASSSPVNLTVLNDELYFTAYDTAHVFRLWMTDGTPQSTPRVSPLVYGGSNQVNLAAFPGAAGEPRLLFLANDSLHGREPWVSDGTPAGTMMLKNINLTLAGSALSLFVPDGNNFFFNGPQGLWISDGTAAHTMFLSGAAIDTTGALTNTGKNSPRDQGLPTAGELNGILYYRSAGNLWCSDGTPAGTYQLSFAPSNLSALAVVGDILYFSADDGKSGQELWRSDGTPGGTYRVIDANKGATGTNPRNIIDFNGSAFFSIGDTRLSKSDGTAPGTVKVFDIPTGFSGGIYQLEQIQNLLYFTTTSEVWSSDGTGSGTIDLTPAKTLGIAQASFPRPLGSSIYFLAATINSQVPGLWKTGGNSPNGATLVKAIGTDWDSSFQAGYSLTQMGGNLYFLGPGKASLWISDGTTAGTKILASMPADQLTTVGNKLYFTSNGQLWVTDGTAAGTVAVPSDPAGPLTNVSNLTAVDGTLVFSAYHPLYDNELWIINNDAPIPQAPSNFSATAVSTAQIHLSWADLSINESGFQIQRSVDSNFATIDSTFVLPPNELSFDDRSLTADTHYYYRLCAFSRSGNSDSLAADVSTQASAPPSPSLLTATLTTDSIVMLTWKDRANDETGYVLQRALDPAFNQIDATFSLPADTKSYVDTTTAPLIPYYYRLFAVGAEGDSDYISIRVITPDRAPAVLSEDFIYDLPSQVLLLKFGSDVSDYLTTTSIHLRNLTTLSDISSSQIILNYDRSTRTASIGLKNGTFPDGRYSLTLHSSEITNNNGLALDGDANGVAGGDFTYTFFQLAGDANRDGTVGFADLVAVAQNYGVSSGASWFDGDLNADGMVNFADLVIIAQHYGDILASSAAVAPLTAESRLVAAAPLNRASKPVPAAAKAFARRPLKATQARFRTDTR